jgi:hypothetical protein
MSAPARRGSALRRMALAPSPHQGLSSGRLRALLIGFSQKADAGLHLGPIGSAPSMDFTGFAARLARPLCGLVRCAAPVSTRWKRGAQANERISAFHSDAGRMRQGALRAEMRRRCRREEASKEISYDLCRRAMGWPASCRSLLVENLRACGIRKTVSAILVNFYSGSM